MSLFDDKPALTVFNGDKDRTQARKVQDLIDPMSIRARRVDNGDGTVTIHRMRGGFPEAWTIQKWEEATDDPSTPTRGYVSNIRSLTLDVLGKVIAAIIAKVSGVWRKKAPVKYFGPYAVSNIISDPIDIWANVAGTFYGFTALGQKKQKLSGATEGVPILLTDGVMYRAGSDDTDDCHIFLLHSSGVSHAPWRSGVGASVYSPAELSSGTAGYSTSVQSGVSYNLEQHRVGYSALFESATGNILQRARSLSLSIAPPFVALETFVDHVTQGYTYIPPSGSASTTHTPGVWLNPIPPQDTTYCATYTKVGGPYPSQGYMNFAGYLVAEVALDTSPVTTYADTTEYTGSNGYTTSKPIGWFGDDLVVDVAVSTSAYFKNETSTGVLRLVTPTTIAYVGYGSTTEPPAITYQWMGVQHTSTTTAGTLADTASSGTTIKKVWNSQSTASATLLGVPLLTMTYIYNGESLYESGYAYTLNSSLAYQGATVNFANPNDNAYAAAWDAQTFCYEGASSGQYNSGYIRDQVVISTNTGSSSKTFSAETRDYILFDRANSSYVYLKGVFSGGSSSSVTLSIVVSHEGNEVEQVIRQASSTGFGWLLPDEQVYNECRYWNPPNPFSGFAPPFCNQGEFPYAAYTETQDTGSAVMLLSLPLVIQQNPATDTAPNGSYVFNPRNFRGVFGYASIALTAPFWSGFGNVRNIVNFADGVFVDWVTGVYPESSQDASTYSEVYRT